jgi:hypothetical protein
MPGQRVDLGAPRHSRAWRDPFRYRRRLRPVNHRGTRSAGPRLLPRPTSTSSSTPTARTQARPSARATSAALSRGSHRALAVPTRTWVSPRSKRPPTPSRSRAPAMAKRSSRPPTSRALDLVPQTPTSGQSAYVAPSWSSRSYGSHGPRDIDQFPRSGATPISLRMRVVAEMRLQRGDPQ